MCSSDLFILNWSADSHLYATNGWHAPLGWPGVGIFCRQQQRELPAFHSWSLSSVKCLFVRLLCRHTHAPGLISFRAKVNEFSALRQKCTLLCWSQEDKLLKNLATKMIIKSRQTFFQIATARARQNTYMPKTSVR